MIPDFFVQIQSKHDETGRSFVTSGVAGMSIRGNPLFQLLPVLGTWRTVQLKLGNESEASLFPIEPN